MRQHSRAYTDYLKSAAWQRRRQARLKRAGYRCERCRKRKRLDVHHKTYRHLGHEPQRDLIALCTPCHRDADADRRAHQRHSRKHRRADRGLARLLLILAVVLLIAVVKLA